MVEQINNGGGTGGAAPASDVEQAISPTADIMQGNEALNNGGGDGGNGIVKEVAATPTAQPWMSSLSDEHKNDPKLFKYQTQKEMVDAHLGLMGKEGAVTVPGANASTDELAAFDKARGVPPKADGYTFAKPEGLPDSVNWDTASAEFAATAHKLRLPPAEAQKMALDFTNQAIRAQNAITEARNSAIEKSQTMLKEAWHDKYEENVITANAVAAKAFGPDGLSEMKNAGVDTSNPYFIKAMYQMRRVFTPDSNISLGQGEKPTEDMFPSMAQ